jgi:hypothetical protein
MWVKYVDYLSGGAQFASVDAEKNYLNAFSKLLTLDSKRGKECFNVGKLGELAVRRVFAEHGIPFEKYPYKENVRPDGFVTLGGQCYIVEIKSRTYTCTGTASEKIDCIPRKLYPLHQKYGHRTLVIFVGGQIKEKSGSVFLDDNGGPYITRFKDFAATISGVDDWISFSELPDWIGKKMNEVNVDASKKTT